MREVYPAVRMCAVVLPMILLAACGGGGGVGSTPTPTSTSTSTDTTTTTTPPSTTTTPPATTTTTTVTAPTTPTTTPTTTATTTTTTNTTTTTASNSTPTPATTPSTINYDDAEYRRSNAASSAGAITAYGAGATGRGVKIAIVDSGLTDALGQFTGRIDAASADMVASRGIGDESGHGTSVAAVAAAGRNGSNIMGVAFDATLLIARTDTAGSCASSSGCSHLDSAIARGVDLARTNGAKVINISLGGNSPSNNLITSVQRATAAGIVVVVSAGNDGDASPDAFAQLASLGQMNGMVIIAGAHDASGTISSFSDRAGSFGAYYLTALGSGVRAFNQNGQDYLYSGTSYSAPTIAGAVAVLAQAFPTLTGKQIVELLYRTATDAGAAGVDDVYGHGILNLAKAFQPQGATSLAGSAVAVSTESANGVTAVAMGDAVQTGASARAVILDGYGRAYDMDLGRTVATSPATRPLAASLLGNTRSTGFAAGAVAVSVNLAANSIGEPAADVRALGLDVGQARAARMLSGRVLARVGAKAQAMFGWREGAGRLAAMLDGRDELPFLVARDIESAPGFVSSRGQAVAFRRDLGFAGLTVGGESGVVARSSSVRIGRASGYNTASARLDRRFGALSLAMGLGMMRENSTVLGARFGAALGGGGATSQIVDARAGVDAGAGWSFGLSARQAWTSADRIGPLASGKLSSNAFAFDVAHVGIASRMGLRIAQPLRVESGGLSLTLPTSYDYDGGTVGYGRQTLNLAPNGREIDIEASWGAKFGAGWLDANAFVRRQPGNFANAAPDTGFAVRYASGF